MQHSYILLNTGKWDCKVQDQEYGIGVFGTEMSITAFYVLHTNNYLYTENRNTWPLNKIDIPTFQYTEQYENIETCQYQIPNVTVRRK